VSNALMKFSANNFPDSFTDTANSPLRFQATLHN
jgi:hypothetical protein